VWAQSWAQAPDARALSRQSLLLGVKAVRLRRVAVRVRVTCPECAEAIEADASTDVPRSALVARIDVYNGAGTPVLDDATPRLQQHLKERHRWEATATLDAVLS